MGWCELGFMAECVLVCGMDLSFVCMRCWIVAVCVGGGMVALGLEPACMYQFISISGMMI